MCPVFFENSVYKNFIEVGQHCQPWPGYMVEQDGVNISLLNFVYFSVYTSFTMK